MALRPEELLQPSLLDRLTDQKPHRRRESQLDRVISITQLRQYVLRDLESLLNTGHLEQSEDLDNYPNIQRSVLNYGSPDLAGRTIGEADIATIESQIRMAILRFEPRILKRTLVVKAFVEEDKLDHNRIAFEIRGDVWAEPVPLELLLKSEIDFESGQAVVYEAT